MELIHELANMMRKKDNSPVERLDYNRVRATIESQCEEYLKDSDDTYQFEALPSALDATLSVLEGKAFQEKYEFSQISPTCFLIRLREIDLM